MLHDIPEDASEDDDEICDDKVVEYEDDSTFELGEVSNGVSHIPRLGNDRAWT